MSLGFESQSRENVERFGGCNSNGGSGLGVISGRLVSLMFFEITLFQLPSSYKMIKPALYQS